MCIYLMAVVVPGTMLYWYTLILMTDPLNRLIKSLVIKRALYAFQAS